MENVKRGAIKKSWFYVSGFLLIVVLGFFVVAGSNKSDPSKVIDNLYKAIDIAEERGDYACCIEPKCTMCYLGHWKFEKGTCFCDDAIAEGRDEDICPECVSGLEEGLCSSIREEACEI